MKSKDFEPKFQPDFEDYDEEEYVEKKPKKGGWWRLPVGVIVAVALGCGIGGGVFATGKLPSKTAGVETEAPEETRKAYSKTEKKESKISIMITTDDMEMETETGAEAETTAETEAETKKVVDTDTVIKLLIKDEDGRTSIDETEVPLNKLTEIGSLKKGSYILYVMRVPVSETGTTYTLADNGIRFEVTGDGMPVSLELKLSSSADGSTMIEVTNSDDSGVSYSYVDSNDYYYNNYAPQGNGGGNSSTTPDNGSSATNPGGTTDPGTTDPGTTDPGTSDPGTSDPGTTDPGTTDPGTTDPGDGGYDGGSDGGYDGGGDSGYDGGGDSGYDGGADYSVDGGAAEYSLDSVETAE